MVEPSARSVELIVDITDLATENYLVHVNHVIAESVVLNLIGRATSLQIRHVSGIDPIDGPFDYLRVAPDRDGELKCFAALTR